MPETNAHVSFAGASWSDVQKQMLAAIGPGAMDTDCLLAELRHRFKGEVQALSEYLGRDLVTLWGYDSLP